MADPFWSPRALPNPPPAKPLSQVVTPQQEEDCACFAVTRQPDRASTGLGKVQRRPAGMTSIDWLTWVAYWSCYPFLPTRLEGSPGKPLRGDERRGRQAWMRMRTRVDDCARRLGVLWHRPRDLPSPQGAPGPSGPPKPAYPEPPPSATKPSDTICPPGENRAFTWIYRGPPTKFIDWFMFDNKGQWRDFNGEYICCPHGEQAYPFPLEKNVFGYYRRRQPFRCFPWDPYDPWRRDR